MESWIFAQRKADVEGVLWTLARRLVPLEALKQKVDSYVAEGVIDADDREKYVEMFEQMQGVHRQYNMHRGEQSDDNPPGDNTDKENIPMTTEELREDLGVRERNMQTLPRGECFGSGRSTDQWR